MIREGLNFSHFGLYVHNMVPMEDFYTRILEFTVTDRGQLPGPAGARDLVFLSRDPDEHHQIVLMSGRPAHIDFNVINQISLKANSLATLRTMHRRLVQENVPDIMPITHGNALSIYAPDPEGNRLELYLDLPWYVSQPLRVPVELSKTDTTLWSELESHARSLPGFRTRVQWRREMAQRMGLD